MIARQEPGLKTFTDKERWVTFDYWPINSAVMGFRIYEIRGMSVNEEEMFYELKGADSSMEQTEKLEDAVIFMDGDIKFDGCCNVIFSDQENCMPHFCGNPAEKFRFIFDSLYAFAAELMPDHRDYLLK